MKYQRIPCKQAIHKIDKARLPYALDLNIYRGCEHKCQYCFAAYSHQYMNSDAYFEEVFIKEDVAQRVDEELTRKRKKKEVINIGGVCDSYQPIEAKEKIMPDIWKVMIKHQNPVIVSTKSSLIERDISYIQELSSQSVVNIACTITTMDETTRSIIEPGASPTRERFHALQRIKKETNAIVGVHIMPIIPYINDSQENLEAIFKMAKEINADYILCGTLYLRGITKKIFFDMIRKEYPHLYDSLYEMYSPYYSLKEYKRNLYTMIHQLEKKYNISNNYMKLIKEKEKSLRIEQLTLF